MKDKLSTIALVAIVAVSAGLIGYASSPSEQVNPATSFVSSALVSGHMQLELRDSDGNIKAYRQTDNVITKGGENCASKALFAPTSYNTGGAQLGSCTGAVTQPFSFIALGTGTATETNDDADMQTQTAATGLAIAPGAVTFTNSTGGSGQGTTAAVISIANTFTNTSGGTVTVSEAGLFNDTASLTNGMFAHKTFTGIVVNSGDSLQVTWAINIGNSTTLN